MNLETNNAGPSTGHRSGMKSFVRALLVNGLGTYVVYRFASRFFPEGSSAPLLIATIVPSTDFIINFMRRRKVDVVAIIVLVQLVIFIILASFSASATDALVGHAFQHAALGLVFLLSVLIKRPLIGLFVSQFVAGNAADQQPGLDAQPRQLDTGQVFSVMTVIWGVTFILVGLVLVALADGVSAQSYLLVSPVISHGTTALLILGSVGYGRRRL